MDVRMNVCVGTIDTDRLQFTGEWENTDVDPYYVEKCALCVDI